VYCSKCGNSLAQGTPFCMRCGQSASAGVPAAGAVASAAAPVMIVPAVPGVIVAGSLVRISYAGFWLRFVAQLIDGFILGILFLLTLLAFLFISGIGAALSNLHSGEDISSIVALFGLGFIAGFLILVFCGPWLYYAFSESSDWQATPGKKMLGLRVTNLELQPISFGRATGRYFGKFLSGLLPFAIGYIMAGFTEKRQALHDMLAGCLVLRND
jgi:uncharacterized RDD family membrane protein YckC